MHSATTATGRPLPPPGKSLPKNRPAPLSCRAAHQLAAPKPHVTSELQCYIPAPAVTCHSSLITRHRKFNRQPRRLESVVSHTKQTPAPQINRQQMRTLHPALSAGPATSKITHLGISNRRSQQAAPGFTRHSSRITRHCRSNRQWQILEINVNLSKQTTAPRSNRHRNAFSNSKNLIPRPRTTTHHSRCIPHRRRQTAAPLTM